MIAGIICYSMIGIVIGVVFSLLFINFDKSWKKIASSILTFGGAGGIIVYADKFFEINEQQMKFWTVSCLFSTFLLSFIIMMFIMCKLIKDKDDDDILRIRDILLGQKSYIDKYYESREKEIDEKLNIEDLKEREENLSIKERALAERLVYLEHEEAKIDELGKKKLKLPLPENSNIILTKDYIDVMPSHFKDIINCIIEMKNRERNYLENDNNDFNSFRGYLFSIALSVSSYIFNGNSSEIRIHFRYYDANENGYKKLIAIIGRKIVENDMTFIPYDKDNMILKSYECKRALIKSINSTYDYQSNNHNMWKDYMTYTFYNLDLDGKPILSFGISVKNEKRYEKVFHLINYLRFEEYLQEIISSANDDFKIKSLLYGGN